VRSLSIIGAGAFGTALAAVLASTWNVTLWGRDAGIVAGAMRTRELPRLPGVYLSDRVALTADIGVALTADILLLALPAQALRPFLADHAAALSGRTLVACCKGIDLQTMLGPWSAIREAVPDAAAAVLTGPSFAADIGRGLPTALTLAAEPGVEPALADELATGQLRLYRSDDPRGAELGGALKNVIAIASGLAIGAGFGESARAALITRGYAEMQRLAARLGAQPETLAGLSGLGDLVLTATSEKSRNYTFGLGLAAGHIAPETGRTVEGHATARAVEHLARDIGVDMPIVEAVAEVLEGRLTPAQAAAALMSRPLRHE
jgi:glycerol-3-phosphate dehydrogenase (NAD(P)+)